MCMLILDTIELKIKLFSIQIIVTWKHCDKLKSSSYQKQSTEFSGVFSSYFAREPFC